MDPDILELVSDYIIKGATIAKINGPKSPTKIRIQAR